MTAQEWVEVLRYPDRRLDAIHALAGGVTATALRQAQLSDETFRAIAAGTAHQHPQVRWWCIQILDHVPDTRAVAAIAARLDDSVPRVRRNAAHALGCFACKPGWDRTLPGGIVQRLQALADGDPNAKVRDEARRALICQLGT